MTKNALKRNIAIAILAIVVMLVVMITSIYYPYPSGQSMDIAAFIKLWFRELLILGVLLIAIIYEGSSWLWRHFNEPKIENKMNLIP
jgi:hypothetical protein